MRRIATKDTARHLVASLINNSAEGVKGYVY